MKKLFTFILVALLPAMSTFAKKSEKEHKNESHKVPIVQSYISLQTLFLGNGNLSPLGFSSTKSYKSMVPNLHLYIGGYLSKYSSVGVVIDYSASNHIVLPNVNSNLTLLSAGLASVNRWEKKHLVFGQETSLSYLYYNNTFKQSNTTIGRSGTVNSHGLEVAEIFSIGYKVTKSIRFNLQAGIKLQHLFKWTGENSLIDDNSYNSSVFGKKSNLGVYPVVGISLETTLFKRH